MNGITMSWKWSAGIFVGALVALWVIAVILRIDPRHPSFAAHFAEQARAWLHGQIAIPAWLGHDLVQVHGQTLMVYPPLPALLMVPFVALLGAHFSDVPFTWVMGAANVTLLFLVLEACRARGWSRRPPAEHAILALTFGFGTIALWLAIGGAVWFTAQTIAVGGLLLMLLGTVSERWWLATSGLAIAFLTRSPDVLAGLLPLLAWANAVARTPVAKRRHHLRRDLLPAAIPLCLAGIIWMGHNLIWFGGPFSTGYDLQLAQSYPEITHGLLSWHYLWPNIVVDFLNLPSFQFRTPFDLAPSFDYTRGDNGTSLFFTTPLFLLLLFPARGLTHRRARWALWATVAVLIGFALLWNGTGWLQVGARYLFDAYPLLFVLLAMRPEPIGPRWLLATGFGMAVNLKLAQSFWCRTNCHVVGSTRWWAIELLLCGIPLLCLAAWWWLRQPGKSTGWLKTQEL